MNKDAILKIYIPALKLDLSSYYSPDQRRSWNVNLRGGGAVQLCPTEFFWKLIISG